MEVYVILYMYVYLHGFCAVGNDIEWDSYVGQISADFKSLVLVSTAENAKIKFLQEKDENGIV